MSTKIDLPGGGWAEIKDPEELTNRERKLLRRHAFGARELRGKLLATGIKPGTKVQDIPDDLEEKLLGQLTAEDLEGADGIQAAFIVAYTASWSLTAPDGNPLPLPTMETVDDLPGPIYDALSSATSELGDGGLDTTVDGATDPGSPTGPSPA